MLGRGRPDHTGSSLRGKGSLETSPWRWGLLLLHRIPSLVLVSELEFQACALDAIRNAEPVNVCVGKADPELRWMVIWASSREKQQQAHGRLWSLGSVDTEKLPQLRSNGCKDTPKRQQCGPEVVHVHRQLTGPAGRPHESLVAANISTSRGVVGPWQKKRAQEVELVFTSVPVGPKPTPRLSFICVFLYSPVFLPLSRQSPLPAMAFYQESDPRRESILHVDQVKRVLMVNVSMKSKNT